jgi:predicted nucleic acid-binding protein
MPDTLVVDCSVAAKWVLPEPDRDRAMRLLEAQQAAQIHLIAPDLLLAEFASLLAKRHRRKQLSGRQAALAYRLIEDCPVRLYDLRPRAGLALALAIDYDLSLWDSLYVALAVEHGCPVVTADQRLFRRGKRRHPAIRLLSQETER